MKKRENHNIELCIKKVLTFFHLAHHKKLESLLIQIFKFGIVGLTATLIDFITIFILKEFLNFPVILANTISFCVANQYNYQVSTKWVFNVDEKKKNKKTFIIFLIFSIVGLLLNDLIMMITTSQFKIYYLFGKVIATCIVMIYNFITRKLFLE